MKKNIIDYLEQFPNEKKNLVYKYKIDMDTFKKIQAELINNKICIYYIYKIKKYK